MLYFRRGRLGLGLFRVSLGLVRVRARVVRFSLGKARELQKFEFSIKKKQKILISLNRIFRPKLWFF